MDFPGLARHAIALKCSCLFLAFNIGKSGMSFSDRLLGNVVKYRCFVSRMTGANIEMFASQR